MGFFLWKMLPGAAPRRRLAVAIRQNSEGGVLFLGPPFSLMLAGSNSPELQGGVLFLGPEFKLRVPEN